MTSPRKDKRQCKLVLYAQSQKGQKTITQPARQTVIQTKNNVYIRTLTQSFLPEFVEVIHVIKVCVLVAKMWHSLLVGPPEERKSTVSIKEVSTRQLSPVHKIGVSETTVNSS